MAVTELGGAIASRESTKIGPAPAFAPVNADAAGSYPAEFGEIFSCHGVDKAGQVCVTHGNHYPALSFTEQECILAEILAAADAEAQAIYKATLTKVYKHTAFADIVRLLWSRLSSTSLTDYSSLVAAAVLWG